MLLVLVPLRLALKSRCAMRLLLKQRALFVVLMLALLPPAASKPATKFFYSEKVEMSGYKPAIAKSRAVL
jgi:hypothetical protein